MNDFVGLLASLAGFAFLTAVFAGTSYLVGGARGAFRLSSAVAGFFGLYLLVVVICKYAIELPMHRDEDSAFNALKVSYSIGVVGAMLGFVAADLVVRRFWK